MHAEVEAIRAATDWHAYYAAYRSAYTRLIQDRWGYGEPTFGGNVHHTAIPDASGSIAGTINWAAYSQPSAETLVEFAKLFISLVRKEPHRARTNRYLFFILSGAPADKSTLTEILLGTGLHLDFCSLSLEEELQRPHAISPLSGLTAAVELPENVVGRINDIQMAATGGRSDPETLPSLGRTLALSYGVLPTSTVLIAASTVLMTAFRLGVPALAAGESIGQIAGLAAFIAEHRARESLWDSASFEFFNAVRRLHPPSVEKYVIQPGDILSRIVRARYELPFERVWPFIRAVNPQLVDPNRIRAGAALFLPTVASKS